MLNDDGSPICPSCAIDPDPRGPSACAACRELSHSCFKSRENVRVHEIFDLAGVPRTSIDNQKLTLEQRATILVHWYQKGRR